MHTNKNSTGQQRNKNSKEKKMEEDVVTQEKLVGLCRDKVDQFVLVDPILDEKGKAYTYTEVDSWPAKNWKKMDWLRIFGGEIEKIKKRISSSNHNKDLEDDFERIFRKENNFQED